MGGYIKVDEIGRAPTFGDPPGFYYHSNNLWFLQPGSGMAPACMYLGATTLTFDSTAAPAGGLSMKDVLTLIAIGSDPNRVHEFTGGSAR